MSDGSNPVVVRHGKPDENLQLEALKLLLKTGSRNAASVTSTGGDDTKVEGSKNGFRATDTIQR